MRFEILHSIIQLYQCVYAWEFVNDIDCLYPTDWSNSWRGAHRSWRGTKSLL